jgi:sugar/nucleoside kinase (ribokinase family)
VEVPRVYAAHSVAPKLEPAGESDSPDLVVVGAASRDITPDDPRGWRLGGSATYCSLTAARLGLRVGCLLGVDADAAAAHELDLLEAAGVDLRRVALERGPVFENIERNGHRRQRWLSECAPLSPAALPEAWRGARAWLLVPIARELPEEWSAAPAARAAVGIGWQGMLREFADDGWVRGIAPGLSTLLEASGLVVTSVDDLPSDATIGSLRRLAPRATIVLTAGERGGIVVRTSGLNRYRAIPGTGAVDPTGAGDVFLAALMVAWLLRGEPATSGTLRFAAAAASCVVEGPGLSASPTLAQVAERLG